MSTSSVAPSAFRITQIGLNAATAAGANGMAVTITSFKLGSAHGYTPSLSDTSLRGGVLFSAQPYAWNMISDSSRDIVCKVPATAGPFSYGEIGLFLSDGTLFALAAFSDLQTKSSAAAGIANALTFHCVLNIGISPSVIQVVTGTAGVVANIGSTQLITGPDSMPGKPNAVIVTEPVNGSNSLFLTAANSSQWTAQNYLQTVSGVITEKSSDGKTLKSVAFASITTNTLAGDYLVQDMRGNVRVVEHGESGTAVITYPISGLAVGDTILLMCRTSSLDDITTLEGWVAEQNAEQTEALNAATAQMNAAIATLQGTVTTALASNTSTVNSNITSLTNSVDATMTGVNNNLTAEVTRAQSAEAALGTRITNSVSTLNAGMVTLQGNIDQAVLGAASANELLLYRTLGHETNRYFQHLDYNSLLDIYEGTRSINVNYANPRTHPIYVTVSLAIHGAGTCGVVVGGITVYRLVGFSGVTPHSVSFIVPPNQLYSVSSADTTRLLSWAEMT